MTKVLIIEDNPYLCELFELAFTAQGCEVVAEKTGVGGKNLALTWQPDLIVLDLMMPDLDGLQVLTELRPALPACKIAMCSNLTPDKFRDDALALGADLVIDKSLDTPHEMAQALCRSFNL